MPEATRGTTPAKEPTKEEESVAKTPVAPTTPGKPGQKLPALPPGVKPKKKSRLLLIIIIIISGLVLIGAGLVGLFWDKLFG